MRSICIALALTFAFAAGAQAPPPNSYSCSDIEWLEPGWTCTEHFTYGYPISVSWDSVDFDRKGNLWRGTRDDIVSPDPAFCGPYLLAGWTLFRYEPGFGWETQDARKTVARFRDRCVGGALTTQMFTGNIRVLEGGALIIKLAPRDLSNSFVGSWVIKISSDVPAVLPSPASDHGVSPDLALGNAGSEGEASRARAIGRRHE